MSKKTFITSLLLIFLLVQVAFTQNIIDTMADPGGIYWRTGDWETYFVMENTFLNRYDYITKELVQKYVFPNKVTANTASIDGHYFAIGGEYWWAQIWDASTNTKLVEAQIISNKFGDRWTDSITNLIISNDGKYVQAKGYSYWEYRCYSLDKRRILTIQNLLPEFDSLGYKPAPDIVFKNPIVFLPKEYGLIDKKPLERDYYTPYLIDLKSETVVKDVGYDIRSIICADGDYLLSRNAQGIYQFWDVSAGLDWKLLATYEKPIEADRTYHISPGGQYIYSSSGENFPRGMYPSDTIKPAIVLNAKTGNLLWELSNQEFKDDDGYVLTGAIQRISQDGTQMFGKDKTGLHIWDISNLKSAAEGAMQY